MPEHLEQNMSARADDSKEMKPTRVVSMLTVISVATPFLLVGGGFVWTVLTGQIARDAARIETDKQVVEKLAELKTNIQVLGDRMQLKSDQDAEQSAAIKDLDRRVTRLEGRP